VHGRLAAINLRSIDLKPGTRRMLDVGLDAITIGTSWARIEAGWHYPSDTLVSASLGAFFASFYSHGFLGLDRPVAPAIALGVAPGGASLQVRWIF
jgi:hypothetical protein